MSASARVVVIGASCAPPRWRARCAREWRSSPKMIDDVGEIALGRAAHDIGRGRPVCAHPHVERTVEAEREAALGLVELHRGHADIHHDAVDRIDALRRADLGELGEAILDQRQPAAGASTSSAPPAIAVRSRSMRDHAGSRHVEDRAAVAAGTEGRVDIDAAVARREVVDGLTAKHGNVRSRRSCAMPADRPAGLASEIGDEQAHNASNDSASRRFHDPTPVQHGYRARSSRATNPVFPLEFVGQPWDFERKIRFGRLRTRVGSSSLSNGP